MTPRGRRILWALIAAGVAAKLSLAFALFGHEPDVNSYALVRDVLRGAHPLDLYSAVNNEAVGPRWPYPPGYLPWILFAGMLADHTPLPFHGLIQVPPVLADAGTAWLVQWELGRRGFGERARLAAAGLVAAGPLYLLISGWWGQLDALATLPALAAVIVWQRHRGTSRIVAAGVLVGVAAAIKTPLGLVILALLPSARGWREAIGVASAAAAVPLILLLPFLAADPSGTIDAFRYSGIPGQGGISLIVQPQVVNTWIGFTPLHETENVLDPVIGILNVAVIAGALALTSLSRAPALCGAMLVWLAVFAFGSGFTFSFVLWLIPFLLIAGRLGGALAAQLLAVPPALLLVTGPWEAPMPLLYGVWMAAVWLLTLWALAETIRSMRGARRAVAR